MIESYDDLYQTVSSSVESFLKQDESAEIVVERKENGTTSMTNKKNGNKLVLMLGRYSDEYKVGFAFFVTDQYGKASNNPEWIEDVFNHEFDEKFVYVLITEHLLQTAAADW